MEQREVPVRLSPGLEWKIEEIPGEDGWWRPSSHSIFKEVALLLLESGVPEKTVVTLLERMYWAVADCYGG